METPVEPLPDLALDDIIKNKREELKRERQDSRPPGERGRGGRGGRGGRRGGNRGRGNFRERSRHEDFRQRRRSYSAYSYSSRSRSSEPEQPDDRPRKKIIIRRPGEAVPVRGGNQDVVKRGPAPGVENFSPESTIQIRNFPTEINMKDMITLFKDFGTIRNLSVNWSKKKDSQCTVYVEFASHKEALRAKDKYNNADMEGYTLRISFLENRN